MPASVDFPAGGGSMVAPRMTPTTPAMSTMSASSTRSMTYPLMSPSITPDSTPPFSPSWTLGVRASLCRTVSTMHKPAMDFSEADLTRAKDLVSEYCTNKGRKSKGEFNYKDANAVLARIADGRVSDANSALVKALQTNFDANASIERRKSTNLFKVIIGRDQEDIHSNVLEKAVRNCSYDIVYALAMQADQDSLDQALPVAISQSDWNKVSILMVKGANATPLCREFLRLVDHDPQELLPLLLGETKGACRDCRNKGLVQASALGNLSTVEMLIRSGADTTYNDAAAFKAALINRNEDIAIAISSNHELKGHPLLLDNMVGEAFAAGNDRVIIECLQTGAKGPVIDEVLFQALKQRRSVELIDMLIRHGASVEHKNGAVVHEAIESRSVQLLQAVLNGKPAKSIISATVDRIIALRSIAIIHDMVSVLFPVGFEGDSVNRLLLAALDSETLMGQMDERSCLVQLLVHEGYADVNFDGGQPLLLAAANAWLEILHVLLSCQVFLPSLQAAIASSMEIADTETRIEILKTILYRSGSHRQLLELAAAHVACKNLDLPVLDAIQHSSLTPEDLLAGFRAALSNPQSLQPTGLPTIRALLHLGASGPEVSQAFCKAAVDYERDAFELFAAYVDVSTVVQALENVVQSSTAWLAPDDEYLWLIHHLLEWGGKATEQANHAFLVAIEEYIMGSCSNAVIETLLGVGQADVNFQSGKALKLAVWGGNMAVFRLLLSHDANIGTIQNVFFEIVVAPLTEELAISFIEILTSPVSPCSGEGFNKLIPKLQAPIRDCLTAHPNSPNLIKRLVKLGVNFDVQEPTALYGTDCDPESCTTLLWCLLPSHSREPVDPAVIHILIEAKVNVNFIAPISRATALILAAHFGHTDTVNRLLKAGANSKMRDYLNHSALFYASRNGHLDAVRFLLKAAYRPNDGSLHEAARNLHNEICKLLIATRQFDVNFPSSNHNGRTPLQEMAYRCDGERSQVEMEETILALKVESLRPFQVQQSTKKNALFLAFENPHPLSVTQALLDILLWRNINSDQNVFSQQETNPITGNLITCHYSPTMYLRKILPLLSEDNDQRSHVLGQRLSEMGAIDRYYSDLACDQPPGAMGYPELLAKEVKHLMKSRQDHEEQLRREEVTQNQKLLFEKARHNQRLQQENQITMQKVQSSAIIHENKIHQDSEVTFQQNHAMEEKNNIAHQARVVANQDRAAQLEVDNWGLAQKHRILEQHQQVTDYQKHRQQQIMDFQKQRQTEIADNQKLSTQQRGDQQKLQIQEATDQQKLQTQKATDQQKLHTQRVTDQQKLHTQRVADQQKLHTQSVTDQQKLRTQRATDQQIQQSGKLLKEQELKLLKESDEHRYSQLQKMDTEKWGHERKMNEQQVMHQRSLAKVAAEEEQRKLGFQRDTAQIKAYEQMVQKQIAGPSKPTQRKVPKQQGPVGYIEDGRVSD